MNNDFRQVNLFENAASAVEDRRNWLEKYTYIKLINISYKKPQTTRKLKRKWEHSKCIYKQNVELDFYSGVMCMYSKLILIRRVNYYYEYINY